VIYSIRMAYWCFNPRARVGRDEMRDSVINKVQAVSIHAPAWGATQREGRVDIEAMFQSTRPRGARLDDVLRDAPAALFQSTRPRGARPLSLLFCSLFSSFNPRARVGRDTLGVVGCRQ